MEPQINADEREEESQKVSKKNILGFSGILKGKQDALKFEREIRNEWEREIII